MRCSNVIVPGLVESDKTKNSPLQAKMNQLLSMKNNKQSQKTQPQLLAKKKLKRNWMFMETGKISSEQRRALDAHAIEGLYRPYTHIEQEIVRREGLRGDAMIRSWFQNLREEVATGEISDEQRREILLNRVNKKLKHPGDDMSFL